MPIVTASRLHLNSNDVTLISLISQSSYEPPLVL